MRNVGGALDLAAMAVLYRPRDSEEMRRAVYDLCDRGYSDHSVAQATSLSIEAVRRLIGERQERRV